MNYEIINSDGSSVEVEARFCFCFFLFSYMCNKLHRAGTEGLRVAFLECQ